MQLNDRKNQIVMVLISLAYLFLFVPPSLTGAKDPNMLAVFQIDEYSQYPVVMRMITPSPAWEETLKHVVVYEHYYYGWTFYLSSAFAILPLRLASEFFGFADSDLTTVYLVVLRELSPLFMLFAISILVYMWTEFKSLGKSAFLFAFLGSIPAVVDNNMWWHAESLTMLLVVLTIFALYKDNLHFGAWFYWASIFCGLATGTKLIGVWFFLTIGIYLAFGLRTSAPITMVRHAGIFVLLMALTILVTNPFLVVPGQAQLMLDIQLAQAKQNSFGWGLQMTKGPLAWYKETLAANFGDWWIYIVALASCAWGIISGSRKRVLNIIVLTWVIPLSIYLLFFIANKAPRYFLPVLLPLFSCVGNELTWNLRRFRLNPVFAFFTPAVMALLVAGLQTGINLKTDYNRYFQTLNRENQSQALEFYRQLDKTYLSGLPRDVRLTVFRDPYVYLPPLGNIAVNMKWGSADYDDIDSIKPDLIMLEKDFIRVYSDPKTISISFDQEQARRSYEFYLDAKNGSLKGFPKLLDTTFGIAFEKQ